MRLTAVLAAAVVLAVSSAALAGDVGGPQLQCGKVVVVPNPGDWAMFEYEGGGNWMVIGIKTSPNDKAKSVPLVCPPSNSRIRFNTNPQPKLTPINLN